MLKTLENETRKQEVVNKVQDKITTKRAEAENI